MDLNPFNLLTEIYHLPQNVQILANYHIIGPWKAEMANYGQAEGWISKLNVFLRALGRATIGTGKFLAAVAETCPTWSAYATFAVATCLTYAIASVMPPIIGALGSLWVTATSSAVGVGAGAFNYIRNRHNAAENINGLRTSDAALKELLENHPHPALKYLGERAGLIAALKERVSKQGVDLSLTTLAVADLKPKQLQKLIERTSTPEGARSVTAFVQDLSSINTFVNHIYSRRPDDMAALVDKQNKTATEELIVRIHRIKEANNEANFRGSVELLAEYQDALNNLPGVGIVGERRRGAINSTTTLDTIQQFTTENGQHHNLY